LRGHFSTQPVAELFRSTIGLDPETWQRARGWAIWKALITLVRHRDNDPTEANKAAQIIRVVLDDHFRSARQTE
jgi:aminoglycoside phosphotransferase (APT) family kinase protein